MSPRSGKSPVATGTSRRALRLSVQGQFLSAFLGLPLSLLAIPITLRHVGIQTYGSYASLTAALSLVGLSEAGVSVEVTRRVAAAAGRSDDDGVRLAVREGMTLLGLLGLAIGAIGVAATNVMIGFTFPHATGADHHRLAVVWVCVVLQIAIGLPLSAYFAVLNGLQRADYGSYLGLITRVTGLILIVVLANMGLGLYALLLSGLAVTGLSWIGSAIAVQRVRPGLLPAFTRPRRQALAPYFAVSLVIVSGSLSNIFDYQFDKVVLSHFSGPAKSGDYQIGTTLSLAALTLALAPIGLLLAGAAELSRSAPERLARLQSLMTRGTYALGAFLLIGTSVYAQRFIPLWLGSSYDGAVKATALLSLALMFNLWSAPFYYYAIGNGWLRETAVSSLANVVSNAGSSYLLTRSFGLTGALLGSLIGNFVAFTTFWVLLRARERRPWLRPIGRPTAVVALCGLGGYLVEQRTPAGAVSLALQLVAWSLITGALLRRARCLPVTLSRTRPFVQVEESG